jgi:hypothetical protein
VYDAEPAPPKRTPAAPPAVRCFIACSLMVRLDGHAPDEPAPEGPADWSPAFVPVWEHVYACMAEFGVAPLSGPPPGWSKVEAYFALAPQDVVPVAEWLAASGFAAGVLGAVKGDDK